ncbi:hypothetical protein D3C80_1221750 [compost metagenome]
MNITKQDRMQPENILLLSKDTKISSHRAFVIFVIAMFFINTLYELSMLTETV